MTEFETAFEKYHRDMYRVVRKTGVPHTRAQDAVQEAARRLSQMSTISYVEPNRVKGLFCKVAINCGKSIMTKVSGTNRLHEEYAEATIQPPVYGKKERETLISITVHRALSQLPELDSYLAWKYFALEMSLREISEDLVLEKGLNWDHIRVHRHLRKVVKPALRKALDELGGKSL